MCKLIKKLPRAYSLEFSPDGKLLVRTSGASVTVYDSATFDQVAVFRDIPYAAKAIFSLDCHHMAVKSVDRKIAVYDLRSMRLQTIHKVHGTIQPQDGGFTFTANGNSIYNFVYTNDLLSNISIIDIETGLGEIAYFSENSVFRSIKYVPEKSNYDVFGFSRTDPANTYFLLECQEGLREINRMTLPYECTAVQFHPKSNAYFAFTHQEILKLSKDAFHIISRHPTTDYFDLVSGNILMSHCISHDGSFLALAFTNFVVILDTESFRQIAKISHSYIDCVSFSPDDQVLMIGGWSNSYLYRFDPY